MKDFCQLIFVVVVIWGACLAAPVFGFFIGSAAAAWVIWTIWKESRNAS